MNIFICDDNSIIQEQLHKLLTKYFNDKSYPSPEFYMYNSGDALLNSSLIPDIVFLDIEMPGINGVEVGKELHNKYKDIIIIVITAYSEYLDDAMRFNVFRYLSKPINKHRLYRNLDDVLEQINMRSCNIIINDSNISYNVSTDDIIMIETLASKRKTLIHTTKSDYLSIDSMQYWFDLLKDKGNFYQSNRSYIINLTYVTSFNQDTIQLYNGKFKAYITKRKLHNFKERYLMYIEHTR